jgi:hypothetical protein
VSLELSISGNPCWHPGNYSLSLTKEMYRNINLPMFSCVQLLMGEAGEEQVGNILCCAEKEMLQCKYECLRRLKVLKTEGKIRFV